MDKTVIVWDVSTGSALRKYRWAKANLNFPCSHYTLLKYLIYHKFMVGRGHAGTVNCVRYNEDSSIAMSGSIDCTVKCWDVKTKRQEPVQTFEETKVCCPPLF